MYESIPYTQLDWASRHLDPDEYEGAQKYFPEQDLPEGEYVDGQTGAYAAIWQPGQKVPEDTVYISTDSLRDLGVMA